MLKNSLKSNRVLRGGVLAGFISRSDWFVSGELDSFVSKLPFLSATLMTEKETVKRETQNDSLRFIYDVKSRDVNEYSNICSID